MYTFLLVVLVNLFPVVDFLELCMIPFRFCIDPTAPLKLVRVEKFLKKKQ